MLNLKILRLTAWLLLLATLLSLFSGFFLAKPFLAPWLNTSLALKLHVELALLLFIILFYLHSLTGIFHLLSRHELVRSKGFKVFAGITWTLFMLLFIYYFFVQYPVILNPTTNQNLNLQQTQTNTNNNTNSIVTNKPPVTQNTNTTTPPVNPTYTLAQIATHNSRTNCWMIINNKVYNLTSYLNQHPGNVGTILPYCGQDGTQAFNSIGHSNFAVSLLQNYYIGNLIQ